MSKKHATYEVLVEKLAEYLDTPEGKFYNQQWFQQYKLNEDGVMVFEPNGAEFIPLSKFEE